MAFAGGFFARGCRPGGAAAEPRAGAAPSQRDAHLLQAPCGCPWSASSASSCLGAGGGPPLGVCGGLFARGSRPGAPLPAGRAPLQVPCGCPWSASSASSCSRSWGRSPPLAFAGGFFARGADPAGRRLDRAGAAPSQRTPPLAGPSGARGARAAPQLLGAGAVPSPWRLRGSSRELQTRRGAAEPRAGVAPSRQRVLRRRVLGCRARSPGPWAWSSPRRATGGSTR